MCQACFGCWRAGRHWFNLAWFGHFRGPHVRKRGRRMAVAAAGGLRGGGENASAVPADDARRGAIRYGAPPGRHRPAGAASRIKAIARPAGTASRMEALDMRPAPDRVLPAVTARRTSPQHLLRSDAAAKCCKLQRLEGPDGTTSPPDGAS